MSAVSIHTPHQYNVKTSNLEMQIYLFWHGTDVNNYKDIFTGV